MSRWQKITLAAGLCLTAGWIYWPALHGGWIWDDRTEMPQMDALRGAGDIALMKQGLERDQ